MYFLVKNNYLVVRVKLPMTFSQSFFEQNVSVQRKLLRFSVIFVIFEIKPEMRDVLAKMWEISQNAGFPTRLRDG